jgi:serine/threonine protein kinase
MFRQVVNTAAILLFCCVNLQALAAGHPNVINISAICFDPLMIIMEQCDTCLADFLQKRKVQEAPAAAAVAAEMTPYPPYSWQMLVNLATQAAAALAALHRPPLGILHNDVRALNMLLSSPSQHQQMNGDKAQLKLQLCDFGLAEFVGTREEAVVPSVTHELWRPPNMAAGQGWRVSQKTDVFALGEPHRSFCPGA